MRNVMWASLVVAGVLFLTAMGEAADKTKEDCDNLGAELQTTIQQMYSEGSAYCTAHDAFHATPNGHRQLASDACNGPCWAGWNIHPVGENDFAPCNTCHSNGPGADASEAAAATDYAEGNSCRDLGDTFHSWGQTAYDNQDWNTCWDDWFDAGTQYGDATTSYTSACTLVESANSQCEAVCLCHESFFCYAHGF